MTVKELLTIIDETTTIRFTDEIHGYYEQTTIEELKEDKPTYNEVKDLIVKEIWCSRIFQCLMIETKIAE